MTKGFAGSESPKEKRSDSWYTPLNIISQLGPFDLDPCGSREHKTATTIYDLQYGDNGLLLPWFGRVWLNPPYSEACVWLDKLAEHGNGVALVFARTDTKWAQKHMKLADQVIFKAGRISFIRSDGSKGTSAGHGSMVLIYGDTKDYDIAGYRVNNLKK